MANPFAFGSKIWPGLAKLAEEDGEVVQVIGKIVGVGGAPRHFDGTNLVARLEEEIADSQAATLFVISHNALSPARIMEMTKAKLALFERWHAEQADKAVG